MMLRSGLALLAAIAVLSLPAAALARDCTPSWKPLRKNVEITTSELQNLGAPGTSGDTTFIGVITSSSRPSLVVQFGYIHPGFPKDLQDIHSGKIGECVEFHFAPKAVQGGADLGVKIAEWGDDDEATVSIWRK
jgi:hypothetical protein